MNKIVLLIMSFVLLMSCTQQMQHSSDVEDTLPLGMEFTIPDTVSEVSNSWAIMVNGEATKLSGEKLKVWDTLKDVPLDARADFFDKVWVWMLEDFKWYKLVETVPSLDTPVCTVQTKQLEFAAREFTNVDFIVISNDTPFALQRFCAANSINNLQVFSDARTREFWKQNSLFLEDYWLLTRTIMIVDEKNTIQYIEYANEVTSELDLMNALAFLKKTVKPENTEK